MRDMLVLLDFDHACARMTARKLRAERVCCRILPGDAPESLIFAQEPSGLVLCAAMDSPAPVLSEAVLTCPVPVLAFGTAAASLASALGGQIDGFLPQNRLMYIRYDDCPLLDNMPAGERMVSGLFSLRLPEDTTVIARAGDGGLPFVFSCGAKKRFGTMMELEPHDPDSALLLANFALRVCGCTAWWDEDAYVGQAVSEIRQAVGSGTALCMMTGGLHSSVAALLSSRALGERLHCVFVNTGLLQKGEEAAFASFFGDRLRLQVSFREEGERFMQALRGIRGQQEKRDAIHSMMQVISREAQRQLPDLSLIIQDRVYSDSQEETDTAFRSRAGVQVVEPLRDLFLDEVRQIGSYLGLPYDMIAGQLIPDTGLALNILGEVTEEKLDILREADAVFRQNVQTSGQSRKLSEYYAVLRPYDKETYSVILRALAVNQGDDFRSARVPYDVLEASADQIRRDFPSVARVLYDLTPSSRR